MFNEQKVAHIVWNGLLVVCFTMDVYVTSRSEVDTFTLQPPRFDVLLPLVPLPLTLSDFFNSGKETVFASATRFH
ncbi:hypothetical protein Plhal304r1_c070g0159371 [Plasmopara halstedii]